MRARDTTITSFKVRGSSPSHADWDGGYQPPRPVYILGLSAMLWAPHFFLCATDETCAHGNAQATPAIDETADEGERHADGNHHEKHRVGDEGIEGGAVPGGMLLFCIVRLNASRARGRRRRSSQTRGRRRHCAAREHALRVAGLPHMTASAMTQEMKKHSTVNQRAYHQEDQGDYARDREHPTLGEPCISACR